MNSKSIFLSHSTKDKFFARKLAEKFKIAGINVWIDEAEINVGDSIVTKIGSGISNSDFVGVILSHNSISSNWVQKELQMAMTKELDRKEIVVLPILIEKCDIPHYLKDKLYVDFTDPDAFETQFQRLLKAVGAKSAKVDAIVGVSRQSMSVGAQQSKVNLVSQLEAFENITIVSIDEKRLYQPDKQKLLFHVYFRLSGRPSAEWVEIFNAERKFPRHTMWRKAWVEDQFIVVHCCLDEIKKFHLRDLKEDVANSNKQFREYLHREEGLRNKSDLDAKKQQDAIKKAIEGLSFE